MRVLLLLYYFPPSGGPGVQRGVKLCRHLPEYGAEVGVVTVPAATYGGPGEYTPDPSMAGEVPEQVQVFRTEGDGGRRLHRLAQAARVFRAAWHLAPGRFFERQAGWYDDALRTTVRAVESFRPDVLLSSSQPYVVHLAALGAHRATGVPWVADFRDPWTTAWGRTWPSRRAFRWEEDREAEVLETANLIVANTPGARAELLARRPWLPAGRVQVVPNGYDPEDLRVPAARRPADGVLVTHTGSFRGRPPSARRGGIRRLLDRREFRPVPYDLDAHSPETLFQALRRVEGRVEVTARLVGALQPGWESRAEDLGVRHRIEPVGYVPHRQATAHLLAADLLYLPTIVRTDGGAVANVPAKTYEYLGSGRPVAALAGPGDVLEMASARPRVSVLEPRDAEGLVSLLEAVAEGAGPAACEPDPADAHCWRRSEVARRMHAALGAALGVEPGQTDKSGGAEAGCA